jgi:hypothetical protein
MASRESAEHSLFQAQRERLPSHRARNIGLTLALAQSSLFFTTNYHGNMPLSYSKACLIGSLFESIAYGAYQLILLVPPTFPNFHFQASTFPSSCSLLLSFKGNTPMVNYPGA